MPELERWVLHRLAELDAVFRQAVEDFDFHRIATELHNFCAVDLSAFYFDIRKDAIYCDAPESLRRRAARTVMAELFSFLTAWLAPITCFTAEEAWLARPQDMPDGRQGQRASARSIPRSPPPGSMRRWARSGRRCARCAASSPARSSSSAPKSASAPACRPRRASMPRRNISRRSTGLDLCEIFITSGGELVEGKAPAGAFTLPDVAGVARRAAAGPRQQMRTLLAGAGGGRQVGQAPAALPALRRGGGAGMRPIDRQAMVLVVVTLIADQASKQFLLGYLRRPAPSCR